MLATPLRFFENTLSTVACRFCALNISYLVQQYIFRSLDLDTLAIVVMAWTKYGLSGAAVLRRAIALSVSPLFSAKSELVKATRISKNSSINNKIIVPLATATN